MRSWRDWVLGLSAMAIFTGGILIVCGSFLPWIDNDWNNPMGLEFQNGRISLALGLLSGALPGLRLLDSSTTNRLLIALLGCLCGGFALGLSISQMHEIAGVSDIQGYLRIVIGRGLYLTATGGAFVLAGSLLSALGPTPSQLQVAT